MNAPTTHSAQLLQALPLVCRRAHYVVNNSREHHCMNLSVPVNKWRPALNSAKLKIEVIPIFYSNRSLRDNLTTSPLHLPRQKQTQEKTATAEYIILMIIVVCSFGKDATSLA